MVRRTPMSMQRSLERFVEAHINRLHRQRVSVVKSCVIALAIFVLALYIVTRVFITNSNEELMGTTWLPSSKSQLELLNTLHPQSQCNAPSSNTVALNQILFISCNRHDRSQAYWANIAVALQCELLSERSRAASAPCRRLYSGQSPLSLTGDALIEEEKWMREAAPLTSLTEVPLGACGSVYDTTVAAQHRISLLSSTKAGDARSPAALRFPVAPRKADLLPLDAVLWLGDAIYADKRADGQDGQSLLYQHTNTLAEVSRFWRTQRDAPEYNAFVSSCVATTAASPPDEAPNKPAVPALRHGKPPAQDTPAAATATHAAAQLARLGQWRSDADTLVVPQPPVAVSGPQHNVWGTWDDHDMGKNDGGKEYPHRNVTQRFLLDFLKAPASDPRWTREGVYEAYTLPFHAAVDNSKDWASTLESLLHQLYEHAICVILLDVRSLRDPPNATYAGDILGAEQWKWFETQLERFTTSTADGREPCAVTLIGSGIQFMLDEKPAENWAAFPRLRDRLLGLLRIYKAERVAFLTGDMHMGELGGDFTASTIAHVLGYPLLEATSSGLTHSANMLLLPVIIPIFFRTPRRLSLYVDKNFATVRLSVDTLRLPTLRPYLDGILKTSNQTSLLLQTPEKRRSARDLVQQALNVTFTIFSIPQHGQPVHRLNFPLSMLTYAHGPAYRDATVDPYRGDVRMRHSMGRAATLANARETPEPALTTFTLRNGTAVAVAHYPTATPVPFITWYSRFAQRHVFTGCSVPESLKRCLATQACVLLALLVLLMGWIWRGVQRRQRRLQPGAPLFVRPSPSRFATLSSPLRWGHKLWSSFQKDKNG
ncbi:hypothetical protein ABL78_0922 [Leptomonas seymouri]|uniref:PhoD-like phosphatase metallophosphatase domain-containing protein n=1 Tax=Leptomonas seymouri TaxID=5684 RepID=A0A0N1PG58_LEPSE|nr:hypothetical protein ABL78_0922 [Leptomonas seymouri]|eukprot:KPI89954.1 hypothetical protein ABL78_0922 [Leptomonas seymouri]